MRNVRPQASAWLTLTIKVKLPVFFPDSIRQGLDWLEEAFCSPLGLLEIVAVHDGSSRSSPRHIGGLVQNTPPIVTEERSDPHVAHFGTHMTACLSKRGKNRSGNNYAKM